MVCKYFIYTHNVCRIVDVSLSPYWNVISLYRNATEDLQLRDEVDSTDDEVDQINTRAEIKKELEKINAIKENGEI